jgi:predicted kinase
MKIIILSGLPGSGKTTWAKKYAHKNKDTVIICRNKLEQILNCDYQMSIAIESAIARIAFANKKDVIIDDDNLSPTTIDRWESFASSMKVSISRILLQTPVAECIRRRPEKKDEILFLYHEYLEIKNNESHTTRKNSVRSSSESY